MTKENKLTKTEPILTRDFFKKVAETYPNSFSQKLAGGRFQSGLPDSFLCLEGKFYFIEFKRKGNTLSAKQDAYIKKLVKHLQAIDPDIFKVLVITFTSNRSFICQEAVISNKFLTYKPYKFPKIKGFEQEEIA